MILKGYCSFLTKPATMPARRRYIQSEDWEKWCNKRKRKIDSFKSILSITTAQIGNINALIDKTSYRVGLLRVKNRRIKEHATIKKRLTNFISNLNGQIQDLQSTTDQVMDKVCGWTEYARQCLPDEDGFVSYSNRDIMEATEDHNQIIEFIEYAERKINDWESDESESESPSESPVTIRGHVARDGTLVRDPPVVLDFI